MTANVCRALLTVFLALCLLSGATASDEFSDALIQDVCVECGSADGHLESCSLYVIPDIIDDSFDTDIPDIVEEPLNPEFSGDDLSSSDAVSSGDDPSSDLLTGSTEPPVQLSFAEQLLACDDLWGMYSKMLSAKNEDVGILYALTADELAVLKEHANLLYLSIPETTSEDMENWEGIIATLTVLEEKLAGTYEPVSVYDANVQPLTDDTYIYFDLAAGNVEITASKYTGYVFEDGKQREVKGSHLADNNYYVYQSNSTNKETTGLVDGRLVLPTYERVGAPEDSGKANWSEYITNNTDVRGVMNAWETQAYAVSRNSTQHTITITGAGTYNLTIDNVWSSFIQNSNTRTTGGLKYDPAAGTSPQLTVTIIGDNRFGNIYYNSLATYCGSKLIFQESEDKPDGTLTVATFPDWIGANHYASVIGGNDSSGHAEGIVFDGGIIFVGATVEDNCSGVGGGGNDRGKITINGGTITVVVASSGAAIGGGIGESSQGGSGTVTITGGTVYAHNLGFASTLSGVVEFIPAAAIGGGSSCKAAGNTGTVTISGGTVYAKSVGGTAIGGGSSTTSSGGSAEVTISGNADVTAVSVGGTVYGDTPEIVVNDVQPGAGIGGGTAGTKGTSASHKGGSATLTVNGGNIKTGSIGGGKCNNAYGSIGSAKVTINGGILFGQVMMEGAGSTFTMNGGEIDNSGSTSGTFNQENGGAVWINTGEATMYGGTIKNTNAVKGGAIYVSGGSFAMYGGNISSTSATANGGAIYVSGGSVSISGGNITDVSALNGGAVAVSDGTFTMSAGTIQNSEAIRSDSDDTSGNGGAVSVVGGSFDMSGGTIGGETDVDKCTAVNGGAVSVTGGTFTMTSGIIQNSTATADGGAVYVNGGTASVTDGSILFCSAQDGGAVYVYATSAGDDSFIMGGSASVLNCTASGNGGAVCVEGGSARMDDGTIQYCTATQNGGAVYVSDGDFVMDSGNLTQNTATGDGGGACIVEGSITIGNVICKDRKNETHIHPKTNDNKAANGGAFAVSGGTLTIYCGEYAGNQVVESNSNGLYLTNGTVVVGSGVDADSLLTKDIVITGTTYKYSDSRLNISEIKLYRSPGDTSPVTIPVDLDDYDSIRLNKSLLNNDDPYYPGTVLIGWSTNSLDKNTTVLSNPASYYPENSKYTITGGGGVAFYAIWGSAEYILNYTVIIPSVVEIPANGDSGTAIVKVDTKQPFFIPNDVGNFNVTLSSFDGELVLQENEDQTVAYSLLKEETLLTRGTVVASFAYNGTKNYEDVTISAEVTGEPIYAGTYQDTVTFSLSLEMEDYGDKCYQGGST